MALKCSFIEWTVTVLMCLGSVLRENKRVLCGEWVLCNYIMSLCNYLIQREVVCIYPYESFQVSPKNT